jgi:hypothetical protein
LSLPQKRCSSIFLEKIPRKFKSQQYDEFIGPIISSVYSSSSARLCHWCWADAYVRARRQCISHTRPACGSHWEPADQGHLISTNRKNRHHREEPLRSRFTFFIPFLVTCPQVLFIVFVLHAVVRAESHSLSLSLPIIIVYTHICTQKASPAAGIKQAPFEVNALMIQYNIYDRSAAAFC